MPNVARIVLDDQLSTLQAFIKEPNWELGAKAALRSPKSNPGDCVFSTSQSQKSELSFERWKAKEIERLRLAVDMVVQGRPRGQIGNNQRPNLHSGRFLLYDPFYAGGDGLAEVNSEGFFDIDDCPPWDTFVTFVEAGSTAVLGNFEFRTQRDGILCWIPRRAVSFAQAGINVTPLPSLSWVEMVGRK
jgi:hypothetical protein